MVFSPLRILAYLVLAAVIYLGVYYLAVAVLSFLGIAFIIYASRWAEYLSAGLGLLAIASIPLIIRTRGWSLQSAYKKTEREDGLKALCKHLKRIGLSATLAKDYPVWSSLVVIGSVRVADRNVNFVELDWWEDKKAIEAFDDMGETVRFGHIYRSQYRCNYVVQARVKGLEDKLEAEGKPIKKSGFLRKRVVDFRWEGKELAQILNSDAKLRSHFLSQRRPTKVEIEPSRKGHPYVRIIQKRLYYRPLSAFPTIETFEAYDRIAHHIRSIANVRP